jgi:polyferredoxin
MPLINDKSVSILRASVQWLSIFWIIGIGIRFGIFVSAMEDRNPDPLFNRPPGVEGFLPIGSLASLKYWFVTGEIHPVHPAAPVIFIAILLMSLVARKSFCSWICPIGTVSEVTYKLGARLFGRNFRIPVWLDYILMSIKYLLLFFFIKVILIDLPVSGLIGFMNAPYWAASDIKMLYFFTQISKTTVVVLAALIILSLIYRNFWCRYLCPYGALLGIAAIASPFKIRRDTDKCTGCGACASACPSGIAVHSKNTVISPECTGCLTCISVCPESNVLSIRPSFWKRRPPVWVFPAVLLIVYFSSIVVGIMTGNWHSSLRFEDYQYLLPMVPELTH